MILKILLNTLLVSIPEETAIFIITCLVAKQKCFINTVTYKYYMKYIIPTIVIPALLSNIIRYGLNAQETILGIFPPLIMLLAMFSIFNYENKFTIVKIIAGFLLGMIVTGLIQLGYMTLILNILNLNLYNINNDVLTNFAFSLPGTTLIYIPITALIMKCDEGINVLGEFFSKKNIIVNIPMIIINLVILIATINIVLYQNILLEFSLSSRILIIAILLSIPSMNVFTIVTNIINSIKKYSI